MVADSISCLSKTITRNGRLELTPVEAVATFYRASLCQVLPVQNIFLKSDAQVVIDALVSTDYNGSNFGHIVDDTKVMLNSFSKWKCG